VGVRYPTVNGDLIVNSVLTTLLAAVEVLLTFKHITLQIKHFISLIKYILRHQFVSLNSGKWVNGSGRPCVSEESDTARLASVRRRPSSGHGKEQKCAGILW
jgi:hypothetical protein